VKRRILDLFSGVPGQSEPAGGQAGDIGPPRDAPGP
jgi:hypothetical protein